jgi:tetratricopeptide (TPR) repeat protein
MSRASRNRRRAHDAARRPHVLAATLLALITFIAFLPTLRNGFVTWDDDRNFLENFSYRGLGWDNLSWMWTTFHMGHYVPLSWMTLGLDYELWGMDARGYHLTNLVLHCANAVLVFLVIRRLAALATQQNDQRIDAAAFIGALFFAIHPLRVESVAWVTERRDVLSGAFYWGALLAYLPYADGTNRSWRRYALCSLLFVCAFLSKATAITLPAVMLLVNFYPLQRLSLKRVDRAAVRQIILELLPFGLIALALVPLTIVALAPPAQLSKAAKLAVSAYSLAFYLLKTVLPTGLSPLYAMPTHVDPAEVRFLVSYGALLLCGVGVWIARRRWPALAASAVAFLLIILPMLGIVQNGPQIAADRYTYHATPALSALLAAGILLLPVAAFSAARLASIPVFCVLTALTWRQITVWHDPDTFWNYVLQQDENSAVALTAMGTLRLNQHRDQDAITYYERATALDPTYAEGHDNLGIAYERVGRQADAKRQFLAAIEAAPTNYESHNNLGILLEREGNFEAAVEQYRLAIRYNPMYGAAHTNWGNALVRAGRIDEAIDHYREAVRLRPDLADAHLNWGVALAQLHRYREAIDQFRAAVDIDPSSAEARSYLATASELASSP